MVLNMMGQEEKKNTNSALLNTFWVLTNEQASVNGPVKIIFQIIK
jgi:hypothetical protein